MPTRSNARTLLSLLLVGGLVVVANFLQALAVGLAFGSESWSSLQTGTDLVIRWFLFAAAAYLGAGLARERSMVIAVLSASCALVFGLVSMVSSAQPLSVYNYLSLAVLVSAVGIGAAARKPQRAGAVS